MDSWGELAHKGLWAIQEDKEDAWVENWPIPQKFNEFPHFFRIIALRPELPQAIDQFPIFLFFDCAFLIWMKKCFTIYSIILNNKFDYFFFIIFGLILHPQPISLQPVSIPVHRPLSFLFIHFRLQFPIPPKNWLFPPAFQKTRAFIILPPPPHSTTPICPSLLFLLCFPLFEVPIRLVCSRGIDSILVKF